MERLTEGLWYERTSASASMVAMSAPGRPAPEPVLRFRRGAMNAHRAHVDLVLLGGERAVEISFHPAATLDFVRCQAVRRGRDANGWVGALLSALGADAERWGTWVPAPTVTDVDCGQALPLALLGGVTHPLLGGAYDVGIAPVGEVPRWASPALSEPNVTAAAVRLFGPGAATRALSRALARFLVSRPAVAWWQLAPAVAGTGELGPDELAAVLGASAGADAGSDTLPAPSGEDIAVLRAGISLIGGGRAKRLVLDAVVVGELGLVRLTQAFRQLVDAKDEVRWPPPVRLVDLEDVCRRATAVDPGPPVPAPPPAPPPAGAFTYPADARSLDRVSLGDLELVLPRTVAELTAWGRMLDNCLADFSAAVAEHRTTVVGVRHRGALVAALELRLGNRAIVQFLGPRNRVPPPATTHVVLRYLTERGLIRAVGSEARR